MTIGIDLRCVPPNGGAGIAHAARELTRALVALPQTEVRWVLYDKLPDMSGKALRTAIQKDPCDILFVPAGAIPPGLKVPAVPWVHDLAIYSHPEWFPQSFFKRFITTTLYRYGVTHAPRVLTVSQDTKNEIVARFGVDPEKIDVTYEGGDTTLAFLEDEALREAKRAARERVQARGVVSPFILALGTAEPRKNLAMLIDAWEHLTRTGDKSVDLVIAGRDGWNFGDVQKMIEFDARIHRLPDVSDDERRDLLLAAEVVAVPSLHEGFGLVALEAMQAGTLVLASRTGALPEVVQDEQLLLPPTDREAWTRAMYQFLSDDALRAYKAEEGKVRSSAMTWERAARVVFDQLLLSVDRSKL